MPTEYVPVRTSFFTPRDTDTPFLGGGFDSMLGTFRGAAMEDTSEPVSEEAPGYQSSTLQMRYVSSLTEMRQALNVQADASFGFLGAEADVKASFAHSSEFHSHSIFIVGTARVVNSPRYLRNLKLRPDAATVLGREAGARDFFQRYGDMFVQEVSTGSELNVVFELKTTSAEHHDELSAELRAKGTSWQAGASGSFGWGSKSEQTERSVKAMLLGVRPGVPLPVSEEDVLSALQNLPENANPIYGGGRPLYVKATTYNAADLAEGATPFSAFHHRQVLTEVATLFEQSLTLSRDARFIAREPRRFASAQAMSLADIDAKALALQAELSTASSVLIHDPFQDNTSVAQRLATWRDRLRDLRSRLPAALRGPRPVFIRRDTSQSGRQAHPSHTVLLPEGYKVLGGGAFMDSPSPIGHALTSTYPVKEGRQHGWTAAAAPMMGRSGAATVWACCIGLYDPNDEYDVQVFESQVQGSMSLDVTVQVPATHTLVGGGARALSRFAGGLAASFPSSSSSWTARAHYPAGVFNDNQLTAYAIGLRAKRQGAKAAELVVSSNLGESGNFSWTHADLAEGVELTGGGAFVASTVFGPLLISSIMDTSHPVSRQWNASSNTQVDGVDPGAIRSFALGLRFEQ